MSPSTRHAWIADFCATWVIKSGGLLVIAATAGILVLITAVAIPLFYPAGLRLAHELQLPAAQPVLAVGSDERLHTVHRIDRQGQVSVHSIANRSLQHTHHLRPHSSATIVAVESERNAQYTLSWSDGMVSLIDVNATPMLLQQQKLLYLPQFAAFRRKHILFAVNANALTVISLASAQDDSEVVDDLFSSSDDELPPLDISIPLASVATAFDVNAAGTQAIIANAYGEVVLVQVDMDSATASIVASSKVSEHAVTALKFVYGDSSFIVGDAAGQLNAWQLGQENNLVRFKNFTALPEAVQAINKASRSKFFAAFDRAGGVTLQHLTSAAHIGYIPPADEQLLSLAFAPRDDAIIAGHTSPHVTLWQLDAPHAEASFTTLLRRIWYEGYAQPAYVWQSSSGSDDFEPKLSMIPLIFGTFKGTLYAMLLVLPLSVAAAVYVSQFASNAFKAFIKPAIEVLASLPSVVIGFLAALWFAPFLQNFLVTFFLSMITMPLTFFFFLVLWAWLRRYVFIERLERQREFLLLLPVIAIALLGAYYLTVPVESYFFQGDFTTWLYESIGMQYDQRNSIVIAFGLGFAVIPVIFSISEDSLDSIPKSLPLSSLALGASRWQTIWRVVLPSASSGIAAASIIGFGRAVGETMIVLMATGNTPIIDPSPFNGMRTLAANIAVEVPEAPVNGTLYRTLFLCAVVLFVLTFIFNTAAELIRGSLRRRYGQF